MKRIILFIFLAFGLFITDTANATHYMGGEITWECTDQGNFRFKLVVYRECYTSNGGTAVTYPEQITLNTNATGFTGGITLKKKTVEDISPKCDTAGPHITCTGMPNGVANMGAIEKYTYTSDASYPYGVNLGGYPPVTGWYFTYSSCCRNQTTSIVNAQSIDWTLRAVMYPYNNTPVNNCFDNSPTFGEETKLVVPSGFPFNYFPEANDPDFDSIHFSWTVPWGLMNTPIVNYVSGFSFSNPLPDSTMNPHNKAAKLSSESGEISFKSLTQGAFVVAIMATSYKCGIKVAEVVKEFQIVIAYNPYNSPPYDFVSGNYSTKKGNDYYFDVVPGDTVRLTYLLLDTNSNTDGRSRIIYDVEGDNLTTLANPNNCPNPPCAIVSSKNDTALSPGYYTDEFIFPIACNHHLDSSWNCYEYTPYEFFFNYRDDFCPVPGMGAFRVLVRVRDTSALHSPDMINVVVDSVPHAIVSWSQAVDPNNEFVHYVVYYSLTSQMGPYIPFDTVYNINQLSTDFWAPNLNINHTIWFKVTAVGGCNGTHEVPADTTTYALFTLGIENHELKNQFNIHPNPTDGNFKLKNSGFTGEIEYAIYTSEGSIIRSEKLYLNKGESIDLSVADQAAGIYFLLIRTDIGSAKYKIIHN